MGGRPVPLVGSRDPDTGQIYYPARRFAADGSLRECVAVELSGFGTLYSWTTFGGQAFGQIDLNESVRVQALLVGTDHEIGVAYRAEFDDDSEVSHLRFRRD